MGLQVGLEVEVSDLILIRNLEEAGKSSVGEDAALVGRVKAVVGLHVGGHKLGDLRLGALRTSGDTHEGAELGGDCPGFEERIVRLACLVCLPLFRGHILRALGPLALLGILDLTGRCFHSEERLLGDLLELRGEPRLGGLELLNNGGEAILGITRGLLSGGSGGGNSWDDGSNGRDNSLNLGGGGRLLGSGLLGSGCSGSRSSDRGGGSSGNNFSNLLGGGLLGLRIAHRV